MTYEETIQFMFTQLPMYQKLGRKAFKKTLANILDFCAFLGNPQHQFKSIHVAGTNGKGSSSSMLAAILQAAGYQTGLYTSPHLKSFTERIQLNGQEMAEADVVDFIERTKPFIERVKPSFFEMTVAMAFDYFAQKKVDYAVIEVGLGGRLDSTNVITPEICLITNISMDHANMLGDTLPKIAFEKAGIIKDRVPVIVSEYQEEVAHVFEEQARLKQAPIQFAAQQLSWQGDDVWQKEGKLFEAFHPALKGKHQRSNVLGVIALMQALGIDQEYIRKGIEEMPTYIQLKGRWQKLGEQPSIFCDVGHNEAGIMMVLEQLGQQEFNQLHMVWGMVKDKEHQKILKMLPKNAHYYFCKLDIPRGMPVEDLALLAEQAGLIGQTFESVREAIKQAKKEAAPNDLIFIGGSTFIVAEIDEL